MDTTTKTKTLPGSLLVVDDEPGLARSLARILRVDHEVTIANNGEEALALIQRGARFDLIFCDLQMPVMNGVEFMMNLDQVAPEQVDRIVFLTANRKHPMARLIHENPVLDKGEGFSEISAVLESRLRVARAA